MNNGLCGECGKALQSALGKGDCIPLCSKCSAKYFSGLVNFGEKKMKRKFEVAIELDENTAQCFEVECEYMYIENDGTIIAANIDQYEEEDRVGEFKSGLYYCEKTALNRKYGSYE